ncbi:MAG: hypothetical protein GY711_17805 [bacterium]|nr:hypothetical protein [bacterium]
MIATVLALPLWLPALPTQDQDVPPIQEVGDAYIINIAKTTPPDMGLTLDRFVDACQQVTGINFTYAPDTATYLEQAQLRLLGTKTVPKEQFYSFFQIMMIINDFVCTEIGPEGLSVIVIESLQSGARQTLRQDAVLVSPDELERYADQPATLITTVINLPNTDVRQLSNSMRTMITDANTQQMLPAGNTDSMVLTGFGSNVVALARMLRIVDEASKVEPIVPEFEVIPLEYASADEIASTIEELLDASRRAAQGAQRGQQQGATGALQQGQQEAKIMVDPRTNSLLVMAMPEDMPAIQELIARLDVDVVERERSYHIYNLENVSADELAETLNDFLQDAGRLEQGRGATGQGAQPRQGGGAQSTEFVVVPDPETNSLLIAASRTRYQELITLIEALDERQDQVLIETALIELTGSDFLDIGVELGVADIPGVDSVGGFGLSGFGMSSLEDTDGDGVPDVKVPNIPTRGISAGILDGDNFNLPVLLQLIEEKRNSNVLNIPSVLVNNNGSATVTTLDEQPTTTVTLGTGGAAATQENFNDYVEAGITMQISPSISASRYLRLDIFLEVSNFNGAVQGSIPPPRTTRTLETQVNVPDGDTMVIGGIIVDNRSETRRQVPFLGDLPIIGNLFARESNNLNRTALYFFVTPHIMQDEHFADLAEISYRKKLEAADTIGHERVRLIDNNFGPKEGEIELSGFDVPLYASPERGEVSGEEVGLDPVEINRRLEEARNDGQDD